MAQFSDLPGTNSAYIRNVFYQLDVDLLFESDLLALGLSIWREACQGGMLPSHQDIDPLNLPRGLLSHGLLVNVRKAASIRLRWRLVGT